MPAQIPIKVKLFVMLGSGHLGPIDLTIWEHHKPQMMTALDMDDPLAIPPEMRTRTQRFLYSMRKRTKLEPSDSYHDQGVTNGDILVLTDLRDDDKLFAISHALADQAGIGMGVLEEPSVRSHLGNIGLILAAISLSVLILGDFMTSRRVMVPKATYKGVELHPAEGLEPPLTPSTFRVEARQSFRIKAARDFDPTCGRVSATIPELSFVQDFTRKELLDGVQSELNPSKMGVFQMTFACGSREIGSAPVSVVIGAGLAPTRKVRWVLSTGKAIYRDDSFFLLPVVVSAEEYNAREAWVTAPVMRDVRFALRDQHGQLATLPDMVIDRNTAISNPLLVSFPVQADYALVAFNRADGRATNEVKVSWKEQGPKLQLIAFPKEIDIYSAAISSASTNLYLADDGFRVKPSETLDILIATPPVIKSDPPEKLTITARDPIAVYKASAGTAPGRTVAVQFVEPKTNALTMVSVQILSPFWFLLAATLAGLIGMLARGAALLRQKLQLIILELFTASLAAFLLYSAELQGWLKPVGSPSFLLSYIAAICIGIVGGYLGLAILKGIAKLFQLIFP